MIALGSIHRIVWSEALCVERRPEHHCRQVCQAIFEISPERDCCRSCDRVGRLTVVLHLGPTIFQILRSVCDRRSMDQVHEWPSRYWVRHRLHDWLGSRTEQIRRSPRLA